MFKKGLMRIGDTEYTLYLIQTKGFYRTDIVRKDGEFHFDVDSVLFSCYKRSHKRSIGDESLHRLYLHSVTYLKRLPEPIVRASEWIGDTFVQTERKGEKGRRLIAEFRNGMLFSEIYELDDVSVFIWVIDESYNIMQLPLNSYEYRYTCSYASKRKG